MTIGDINGDELPDLVYRSQSDYKLMKNLGDLQFAEAVKINDNSSSNLHEIVIADIDNDGQSDILSIHFDNLYWQKVLYPTENK